VAIQTEAGQFHAKARFWLPERDQPVDVTDVMAHIRELAAEFDVRAVSFDPRFFDVPATMLADERIPMVKVPQSVEGMTSVCGLLLEYVKRGEIHHDGDPLLRQHVFNAVQRQNERGFTLAKLKAHGRIDGVIALALALDRAVQRQKKPRPPLFVGTV
jgi:phage terminase large subunit-like protein